MGTYSITVHRTKWSNDLLPLVCGISNAGGGRLIIPLEEKRHALSIRRMRRPFESIPSTVLQELGISCTAEPVMEGAVLSLEVNIPASAEPVAYNGIYYLYTDEGTESMSLVELRERTRTTFLPGQEENKGIAGRQGASASRPAELVGQTFEERSIAAAEELDLTITDEYVLKVLKTNGRVPALRIADLLKVSESTIRRSLKRLKDHGFIKRIGSNKAGYWKVLR